MQDIPCKIKELPAKKLPYNANASNSQRPPCIFNVGLALHKRSRSNMRTDCMRPTFYSSRFFCIRRQRREREERVWQLAGGKIERENACIMILDGEKTCKSYLIELDEYAKSAGVAVTYPPSYLSSHLLSRGIQRGTFFLYLRYSSPKRFSRPISSENLK